MPASPQLKKKQRKSCITISADAGVPKFPGATPAERPLAGGCPALHQGGSVNLPPGIINRGGSSLRCPWLTSANIKSQSGSSRRNVYFISYTKCLPAAGLRRRRGRRESQSWDNYSLWYVGGSPGMWARTGGDPSWAGGEYSGERAPSTLQVPH